MVNQSNNDNVTERDRKMRWVAALLLASASSSCATGHSVQTLDNGLVIHTFKRAYANAHVIAKGDQMIMVDSGLEENGPALAEDLRRAGLEPSKLTAIVITHGHADHAGGASYFKRTFSTRIVAGSGDVSMLASGKNEPLCPTDAQARSRVARDQQATFTPLKADVLVDGELTLDEIPVRILAVAGHTQGSLVVVVGDAVLVGDLFRGAIVGSSAEVHFYMCDLVDNVSDIRQLLKTAAPQAQLFFTGHFGPVSRAAVEARFAEKQ
jgi:hydroxyacylglutathione hydrolase